MKVNTKIPVRFEKVEDYDSRFQKVKIWLMHLGKNYNKSVFSKEVVEEAFDTLKNTPILGYIEESRLGDKDFRGHEMELVVEDGEIKSRYLGQAFGVIPENCNPRFEQKEGDNGDLLDYLVVDGLLWTKFDEAVSILEDSEGEVAQSMELHDEYDGSWDEEGWFHFSKIKFYGACMLGADVLPAMQKASVEKVFSTNVIQNEITRKLEEFSKLVDKNFKEVNHVTLEELLAKYSLSVEALAEKGIKVEEYSIEDLEAKIQEFSNEQEDNQEDGQEGSEGEGTSTEMGKEGEEDNEGSEGKEGEEGTEFENEDGQGSTGGEDNPQEKFQLKFELSHDDIRSKMYASLDSHITQSGFQEDWHYIVSIYESHLVAENGWGDKFYMVDYSKDGDNITLGKVSEVFGMFLTAEEKGALELMRSSFEAFEKENQELKEFKANVMKESHEAEAEELFAQAKFNKLSDEDLADIKAEVHNFSIEEIETKLYEMLGRKTATFSRKDTNSTSIKLKIDTQERTSSSIDSLFNKHGIRK